MFKDLGYVNCLKPYCNQTNEFRSNKDIIVSGKV